MYICSCECVCLLRKVCDKSVQWLDIEQTSAAADLGIRALASYLPGVMPVLTRSSQILSHGCALFDILFAWYFCYVFYPAWIDRD